MIKVKDIMVKKVLTVSKDTPLIRAAEIMAKNSISCVVVTKSKKPIGILTERDIMRDVLVADLNYKKIAVKEVMNKDVPVVKDDMDILDLVSFMKERFLRRVPVINKKGELIGIITETDVVSAVIGLGKELSEKIKTGSNLTRYLEKQKKLYNHLQAIRSIRKKADTGSKDLNMLLGGGYPLGSGTLICGEPGSGKTLIAYSFLYAGLLKNECGIYIFSNELIEDVKNGFGSLGYNINKYEKNKKMFFEDLCSTKLKKDGPKICEGFKDLYSIREFIEGVRSKTKGRIRLVLNIVSQAYRFWKPDVIYRFIFELKHYIMENNITALFLVDKGVQEDKDITSLEQLMDGVIILKTQEEGIIINNYLLIKKIKSGTIIPQKYYLFTPLKGEGFVLKEPS